MAELFEAQESENADRNRPLADHLRPQKLSEVVGQDHIIGEGAPLSRMIDGGKLSSIIFWGPPGCGKTTIARILADHTEMHFEQISAIFSGVKELRSVFDSAKLRARNGRVRGGVCGSEVRVSHSTVRPPPNARDEAGGRTPS